MFKLLRKYPRVTALGFLVVSPIYVPYCILSAEKEAIKSFYRSAFAAVRTNELQKY